MHILLLEKQQPLKYKLLIYSLISLKTSFYLFAVFHVSSKILAIRKVYKNRNQIYWLSTKPQKDFAVNKPIILIETNEIPTLKVLKSVTNI